MPQADRSLASPFRIYGRQSGIGTDFSLRTSIFPCQYNSTNTSVFVCILTPLLEEGHEGEAWDPSNKGMYFRQVDSSGKKITSTLFFPLKG